MTSPFLAVTLHISLIIRWVSRTSLVDSRPGTTGQSQFSINLKKGRSFLCSGLDLAGVNTGLFALIHGQEAFL